MDPLTHTLFGAALSEAGLKKRTALATATLLIGANLPDLDAFTYFLGKDISLALRRGWTHGILAMVVWPPLLAAIMVWVGKWRRLNLSQQVRPKQLLLLATIGVWSHPLLDWLNTYGVRLLMPFRSTWFYGDALYIVDPWLWLMLGAVVYGCWSRTLRLRLRWAVLGLLMTVFVIGTSAATPWARWLWAIGVATVIGLRQLRGPCSPATARLGLIASLVYISLAGAITRHAYHLAGETTLGDHTVESLMVSPVPAAPLRREIIVAHDDQMRFVDYRLLPRPHLQVQDLVIPRRSTPEIDAALGASCVQGVVNWLRFPFFEIDRHEDGTTTVHLLDARYVRKRSRGFGGDTVRLNGEMEPLCQELAH